MSVRRWIPVLVLALAGATACERSATGPAQVENANAPAVRATFADLPVAARPNLLVDAQWLLQHGKRPNVVVVHFGTSAKYMAGHVPGAQLVAMTEIHHTDVVPKADGTGTISITNQFNDLAALRALMQAKGVGTHDRVIVTGDGILQAAHGFLMLQYLGYPQVALLDGGYPAWVAAGGQASTAAPPVLPAAKLANPPRLDEVVSTEWMLAHYQDPWLTVLDALPAVQYYNVAHIPGAVNISYLDLMSADGQKLVDLATMRALFTNAGIVRPHQPVATYCMSGMAASVTYFVGSYLGFDMSVDDSSWQGWTAANGPKEP